MAFFSALSDAKTAHAVLKRNVVGVLSLITIGLVGFLATTVYGNQNKTLAAIQDHQAKTESAQRQELQQLRAICVILADNASELALCQVAELSR